jgi:hypothetical protein
MSEFASVIADAGNLRIHADEIAVQDIDTGSAGV